MNMRNTFVVVFGSAAARIAGATSRQPRDLDVAISGDVSKADGEAMARRWAIDNGLPADLPVDIHRIYPGIGCELPIPAGMVGHSAVLFGSVVPTWIEVTTIPSIIRAFHAVPVRCIAHLANYFQRHYTAGDPIRFNIDPAGFCGDLAGGETYTGDGVAALRNAFAQCDGSEWSEIVAGLDAILPDHGTLLDRLVREDVPTGVLTFLRPAMSGGTGIVLDWYAQHGWSVPYGPLYHCPTYVSVADILARLWDENEPAIAAGRAARAKADEEYRAQASRR